MWAPIVAVSLAASWSRSAGRAGSGPGAAARGAGGRPVGRRSVADARAVSDGGCRAARAGCAAPADVRGDELRTYVRAPDGRAGIYFFAIEAVSALMTISARVAAGIPYRLGNLSVVSDAGVVSYGGSRRDGSGAYRLDVRPGPPIVEPTPLDVWLTARWRAYSWHLGRLLETPVSHEPWPLSARPWRVCARRSPPRWVCRPLVRLMLLCISPTGCATCALVRAGGRASHPWRRVLPDG